ncbi:hypothetical protein N7475_001947 [Penicillium sp. IBT 31633x]|nr:hypothetical protein N7475_001947 [Penicillium sp. IBT 31633x]
MRPEGLEKPTISDKPEKRSQRQPQPNDLLVIVDYKVGKESLRRFLNNDGLRKTHSAVQSVPGKGATKHVERAQAHGSYDTPPAGWAGGIGASLAYSESEHASATANCTMSD